jgi:hypothetical protein
MKQTFHYELGDADPNSQLVKTCKMICSFEADGQATIRTDLRPEESEQFKKSSLMLQTWMIATF